MSYQDYETVEKVWCPHCHRTERQRASYNSEGETFLVCYYCDKWWILTDKLPLVEVPKIKVEFIRHMMMEDDHGPYSRNPRIPPKPTRYY
jgi:transposase-like protein